MFVCYLLRFFFAFVSFLNLYTKSKLKELSSRDSFTYFQQKKSPGIVCLLRILLFVVVCICLLSFVILKSKELCSVGSTKKTMWSSRVVKSGIGSVRGRVHNNLKFASLIH